tara:strand:- start:45 stop:854 length:810 start_codon:yes stop_codon:yes gene_type:complete
LTGIGNRYEISSLTNDKVKLINSLHYRKYRREHKLFVAEGIRICREAAENGWEIKYLLYDNQNIDTYKIKDLINDVLCLGADVIGVTPEILSKISHKENPQNVLCVIRQKWNDLPSIIKDKTFVALEAVRDPGNLGTILRTMDGVGAFDCILLDECTDPFSYETVRSSMGAIFNVNIIASSSENFLKWKSKHRISLIGTTLINANDYTKTNWQLPFVLAMGNEQQGLSNNILNACDQLIKLPMLGRSDSLNLGVSTGIALYESIRKNPK